MPARVRIPAPSGTAGPVGAATARVRLIGADGKPIMGFVGDDLRTEYARIALDEDVIVDLAAQSEIEALGGGQTWYEFTIATEVQAQKFKVQVLNTADVQDLRDLVAVAVAPDLLEWRLLPDPAPLADGRWLTTAGQHWITTDAPPGSGIPDAPGTGGPYGRQAGAWRDLTGVYATAAQGALSDTAMQPLLYDPRGVRADIFSAEHLTGAIDGGTF